MSLRVNIEQVQKQISEIKRNIQDFNTQITALVQIREELENSWKGETAEEFKRQIDYLLNELRTSKTKMENLVVTIENTTTQIAKEDQAIQDVIESFSRIF